MGSGSYNSGTFKRYSLSKGLKYDDTTHKLDEKTSNQDIFTSRRIQQELNPKFISVRECCDTQEHPETKPVILALDVTGSMGRAATECASSMGVIMSNLYEKVKDIQFMTMGIGDFAYDNAPLQVSQFESDIRINEQLDKIYFEFGGGGNNYESYTAAWKFALDRTKLDCYDKRGVKGTIITIGDEKINPYIDSYKWNEHVGYQIQSVETKDLYNEVSKKFNIYHIHVSHGYRDEEYDTNCVRSFANIIGPQHVFNCTIDKLDETITNIVLDSVNNSDNDNKVEINNISAIGNNTGEIVW